MSSLRGDTDLGSKRAYKHARHVCARESVYDGHEITLLRLALKKQPEAEGVICAEEHCQ
jgi:hypothetical protein